MPRPNAVLKLAGFLLAFCGGGVCSSGATTVTVAVEGEAVATMAVEISEPLVAAEDNWEDFRLKYRIPDAETGMVLAVPCAPVLGAAVRTAGRSEVSVLGKVMGESFLPKFLSPPGIGDIL